MPTPEGGPRPAGRAGTGPRAVPRGRYDERLLAPPTWWLFGALVVAALWVSYALALGRWWGVGLGAATAVAAIAILLAVGRTRIRVGAGILRAGPATLDLAFAGAVRVLDARETRRVRGVGADPRAFLLVRPYLARSVRVELVDPDDPTPYWCLATRHPELLAAALRAARPGTPPPAAR